MRQYEHRASADTTQPVGATFVVKPAESDIIRTRSIDRLYAVEGIYRGTTKGLKSTLVRKFFEPRWRHVKGANHNELPCEFACVKRRSTLRTMGKILRFRAMSMNPHKRPQATWAGATHCAGTSGRTRVDDRLLCDKLRRSHEIALVPGAGPLWTGSQSVQRSCVKHRASCLY